MINLNLSKNYILRFLKKKQIKYLLLTFEYFFISFLMFLIQTCLTKSGLLLAITIVYFVMTTIVGLLTILEKTSTVAANDNNMFKARMLYTVFLAAYVFLPENTLAIVWLFAIPICCFFSNFIETVLGGDTLHWSYLMHLGWGCVGLIVALCIKQIFPTIPNFSYGATIFLKNFNLAMCGNIVLTELVDLRSLYHIKDYEDKLKNATDGLTKIFNRKGFDFLDHNKKIYSMAFIDLDHFKKVNDTYGHEIGDEVLKIFVRSMDKFLVKNHMTDTLFIRWGGEEFLLVSQDPLNDLGFFLMKFTMFLRSNDFMVNNGSIKIHQTISAGLAINKEGMAIDELIKEADDQAYLSKEHGRDCIHFNGECLC